MKKYYAFAINPWVVLGCLALGFAIGALKPDLGMRLGVVGDVYVDLLKMVVLPFMVSAVIFSLQRLLRSGGAASLVRRVLVTFGVIVVITAVIGAATVLASRPGSGLDATTRDTFGQIVGAELKSSDTEIALMGSDAVVEKSLGTRMLASLVPSNIFAALASGETLKALVFALLFGFAIGQVPSKLSDALTMSLETVYQGCQTLTRWLNYPLPFVLICMSASQLAKTGSEPLVAMLSFVASFAGACGVAVVVSVLVLWQRTRSSLGEVLASLREQFALALATRSSATCMPVMIESLEHLGFARARVELLVPLATSLLRTGPILYYVCATLFVAQLYDRPLGAGEVAIVAAASILAGLASAGMSGVVTISLTGLACSYVGLPFEAAFLLFVAIDPVCDMLRTLVLVIGNSAAVAVICDRPSAAAQHQEA